MKWASFFTCSLSFFYFLNFFVKKCIFLCQNFGISKICYIFVIQSYKPIKITDMSTQEIKVSMQGETNYTLKAVQIKDLKQGDFFTLKPIIYPTEKQVYERGAFERSEKKYSCTRYDDFCAERFYKGDKIVYTDFIF